MRCSIRLMSLVTGLTVAVASGASAQTIPGGPLPGTGDSTKISSGNRDANAEYNHLIGAADPQQAANNDKHASGKSSAVPASAADIKVGSSLRDVRGARIGTISQVDPDGVVVDTGATKIKVPAVAIGKDNEGLLLGITAERFNELVTKAHARH